MNEQKQQLVEKLKSSSNILVTVRNSPTVDLLSACIGLTILLNKLDKHATAVFSGEIPSTMEFLKPEETLEKDTNSLRDFIIALDKSKADKLRYKVEDTTVRIFITPFKTSLSQDDLEFSQGDFNVDVVVALGAHEQQDLDQAITEHGRILHDAVVVSINNNDAGNLGSINWVDNSASSLSEMVVRLAKDLDKEIIDEQIATALLTGIVAETERFSNARTTPDTMTISSQLMAAGANQQLVATMLEDTAVDDRPLEQNQENSETPKTDDGTLEISHENPENHQDGQTDESSGPFEQPEEHHEKVIDPPAEKPFQLDQALLDNSNDDLQLPPHEEEETPQIKQLHSHDLLPVVPEVPPAEVSDMTGIGFMTEPASGQSPITANIQSEQLSGALDPLGQGSDRHQQPLLSHDNGDTRTSSNPSNDNLSPPVATPQMPQSLPELPQQPEPPIAEPAQAAAPVFSPLGDANLNTSVAPEPSATIPTPSVDPSKPKTLSDLEREVRSPHLETEAETDTPADLDSARNEVLKALQETPPAAEPIVALNAQPVDLGEPLHPPTAPVPPTPPEAPLPNSELHLDAAGNLQMPQLPSEPQNEPAPNPMSPADQPMDMPLPPSISLPPPQSVPPTNTQNSSPNAPPPVPPPMLPPLPQ
jgi:nanoRNase/pAp phosphatase (c-di-AMP/oligoRNAs hydrolase)